MRSSNSLHSSSQKRKKSQSELQLDGQIIKKSAAGESDHHPDDIIREPDDERANLVVQDPFLKHTGKVLAPEESVKLMELAPVYHSVTQTVWPQVRVSSTQQDDDLLKLESHMSHFMKQSWIELHKNRGVILDNHGFVNDEQRSFHSLLSSYKNVFYPIRKHPTKHTGYDVDPILDAMVAHGVDHVLRSKNRLLHQINQRKNKSVKNPVDEQQDRLLGFTQPKVLFLVPMRNKAYNVISRIIDLGPPSNQKGLDVVKEKLMGGYGPDEELEVALKTEKGKVKQKPIDHESIFYGHVSDQVKIGIKVHLNNEFSFFRDLCESDIIITSPLSLALLIEKQEQSIMDALSSIEVLFVDWMDVILMQNWMHLMTVMRHLNNLPKESVGNVHFTQVRSYFLQEQGKLYRQTVLCSEFLTGEMNALFNGVLCSNHAGRVRFRSWYAGGLDKIKNKAIQRFERFDAGDLVSSADNRFNYFCVRVLPKIKSSNRYGVLLFISQYFDFGRVCELLTKESIDFGAITEYTGTAKMTKLQKQFRNEQIRVLVITERAYFYHRPTIKGIQELFFYALPDHAQFYTELLSSIKEGGTRQVFILYSQFCVFQLERILGTEKSMNLITTADPIYSLM